MVRGILAWRDAPPAEAPAEAPADDAPGAGVLDPHLAAADSPLPPALAAAMLAAAEGAPGPLLWRQLAAANCRVAWTLAALRTGDTSATAASPAAGLAAAFRVARTLLRRLGEAAGQPVEPPPQTALADATAALPGVVAAGVPGAGGYDAVFAVIEDGEGGAAAERLWLGWPGGGLTPLLLRDGPAAGQPGAGLREEGAGALVASTESGTTGTCRGS